MNITNIKGRSSTYLFFRNTDLEKIEYTDLTKLIEKYRLKIEDLLVEALFLRRTVEMQKAKIEILSRCKRNNNSFKHIKVFKQKVKK
jgi:hypothetical protein